MKENEMLSSLEIRRVISSDPSSVFDALTNPKTMAEWFYGMEEGRAEVDSDLRIGGTYEIRMFNKEGVASLCADYAPHGEYLEIDPPNRLAFTWVSEGFVDHSVVTIDLKPVDDGTELTLRHDLPESVAGEHEGGWNNCLNHLVDVLAAKSR